MQRAFHCHRFLRYWVDGIGQDVVYRLYHQPAAEFHQFIVYHAYVVGVCNRDSHLLYDFAGVDFMFKEERRDSGFRFAS